MFKIDDEDRRDGLEAENSKRRSEMPNYARKYSVKKKSVESGFMNNAASVSSKRKRENHTENFGLDTSIVDASTTSRGTPSKKHKLEDENIKIAASMRKDNKVGGDVEWFWRFTWLACRSFERRLRVCVRMKMWCMLSCRKCKMIVVHWKRLGL